MQEFSVIARIRSDFATKFGVPRQSGLVDALESTIVFEPEYRNGDALRGLEGFSHIWLIWVFDKAVRDPWSPTVRPPLPPNPIGLSCVRLAGIEETAEGTVLRIRGADLMDGTPILDIKPYNPYADCKPEALGGFASAPAGETLEVLIPEGLLLRIPENRRESLRGVLAQDPRPHYHDDPERIYGFGFGGMEVKFRVAGNVLTVTDIL